MVKESEEKHHRLSRNDQTNDRNDHLTIEFKPKKTVMKYTKVELSLRKGKNGSQKSTMDRKKFDHEFDVKTLNLDSDQRLIWKQNPHIRQVI